MRQFAPGQETRCERSGQGRPGSFAARSWWKDEDEPAEAVEIGLITAEQAAEFRAEGERALEWLLSRRPPYDRDWLSWRPD
jgi:hypothetical protein